MYRVLVGKHEERLLGILTYIWEGNIKTVLKDISWEFVDWINLAEDRSVAGCCEYGIEFWSCVKCFEYLNWLYNHWVLKEDTV